MRAMLRYIRGRQEKLLARDKKLQKEASFTDLV